MMRYPYTVLLILSISLSAFPCDVPVFRYALERWAPDLYEISVLYDQDLSEKQITLLEPLLEKEASKPEGFNYVIRLIDLREEPGAPVVRHLAEKPESFPALVLQYPLTASRPQSLWTGPLTNESIQLLLSSSNLETICQQLVNHVSAVWVFLDSGNKERDDQVFQQFQKDMQWLQDDLTLPQLKENAERESIYLDEELKSQLAISFSIVRMSRDDPEEQILTAMMLGSEPDLPLYADQPMVFPIFGQGRLLYALIGDGINRDTMQTAGQFMVGPCSCQIKDDNPGLDLMTPIVWANHLDIQMVRDRPLPAPIPALGGVNATGELVATQPVEMPPPQKTNLVLINSFYAVGALLAISVAVSAILALRSRD